jgi:signal transduction histidine kinase/ligand-binding sensor domain-containing protein
MPALRFHLVRTIASVALVIITGAAPARPADLKGVLTGYSNISWLQKDGLPAGFVYTFAQAADGYLWLGTTAGLYRFDGARFIPWDRIGMAALPPSSVRALHAGRDGSIWVGFGETGGVARITNGRARVFGEGDGLPAAAVNSLTEDQTGTVWAGTSAGLFRFASGAWEKWDAAHGGVDEPVSASLLLRDGILTIATSKAVLRLDARSQRFVPIAAVTEPPRSMTEASNGTLLVNDEFTGFRIVGSQLPLSFERARGWRLLGDSRGNVWIGTSGQGLLRLRFDAQSRVILTERTTVLTGLLSDGVTSLFEDRDGNIWVGSPEGITRLTPHKARQITNIGLAAGIGSTSSGTVWVGTADALLEFPSADAPEPKAHPLPQGARLRVLHVDQDDVLWVGSDAGLSQYVNGGFKPLAVTTPGDMPRRVDAITADGKGGLWIADADRGFLRWSSGQITRVALPDVPSSVTVVSTFTDSTDRAWFGLSDGRVAFTTDDGLRTVGEEESVDAGVYQAIFEDSQHAIWLAGTSGLTRYANGRFSTVHSSATFPLSNLTAIAEDDSAHLWIGSQTGIVQILRAECEQAVMQANHRVQFRAFDRSDGLAGLPLIYNSTNRRAARDPDGRLWFVTSRGLTLMDPRGLPPIAEHSPARIEGVIADGRRRTVSEPELRLPAGTTSLEFEYTAINLTTPMKQRFRYKLDEVDRDWVDAGGRRQAFYTNLAPRSYRFHVQTSDADSQWTDAGDMIALSIAPHFYQTAWFGGLVLVAVGVGIGLSWHLHLRRVREQFALLIGERARLSRELHDTLLQNLVGIALQFDALANDPHFTSSDSQRREFVRMRRRVESYIREARQSIADLRSPRVETQDLATALREAGEREVDGRAIALSFTQHGSPRAFGARLEEQVLKIGREAIVNAARHAQADRISVELESSDSSLTLRVRDNGTGFDPGTVGSDGASHYGLTGMRERAEDIGGHLSIESVEGRGTCVEARVPLGDSPVARRHAEPILN